MTIQIIARSPYFESRNTPDVHVLSMVYSVGENSSDVSIYRTEEVSGKPKLALPLSLSIVRFSTQRSMLTC